LEEKGCAGCLEALAFIALMAFLSLFAISAGGFWAFLGWVFLVFCVLTGVIAGIGALFSKDEEAARPSRPPKPAARPPAGGVGTRASHPRVQKPSSLSAPGVVAKPIARSRIVGPTISSPIHSNTVAPATSAEAKRAAALKSKAEVLVAKLASPKSRRAYQTELRHMGRPAVDPLIRALGDESLRPFAEVTLIELGRLAEPQLRSAALQGSASVRRAAEQTLNRMGL